jgi:hypothetical protein
MDVGEFFEGFGLLVYGVAFITFVRWQVKSDERMRRLAKSRWWVDRRSARKQGLSQEEWFAKFAGSQRQIVKWAFTPFMVVWFAFCIATIIHSFWPGH